MCEKIIATFDFETDPFKFGRVPEPFCCGFFDGKTYVDFWGADCANDYFTYLNDIIAPQLAIDNRTMVVYAHNGGKFDFFYLLKNFDAELSIINGRIAMATMFGGLIEFRDSYLILPLPLSANAKDSISYDLFEKEVREDHKKEILSYLHTDCTSLHEWVTNFINNFGDGLTLAGAALNQLKQTSYDVGVSYEEYDEKFRCFYFGGRVQCFEVGAFKRKFDTLLDKPFDYVDIRSAYPWAMMKQHWSGTRYIVGSEIPSGDNGSWFIDCDAVSHGALPLRGDDGKLYFPTDDVVRRYHCTGWEILSGLRTGTLEIIRIHEVLEPMHTQSFDEYVNKFFAMKNEADQELKEAKKGSDAALVRYWTAQRLFAKLMLNSCYGKFGQDGRKFEKYKILPYGEWPEDHVGEWSPYSEALDFTIFSRPDPVNRYYNVATAASITGCVRAYLWESINASERPLYCDTDSIMCEKFNGRLGGELGDWEMECNPSEIYIAQRKMYALKIHQKTWPFYTYKSASKGVRLKPSQIIAGLTNGEILTFDKISPTYSLKLGKNSSHADFGARFTSRKIDFKNIDKNVLTNPPLK